MLPALVLAACIPDTAHESPNVAGGCAPPLPTARPKSGSALASSGGCVVAVATGSYHTCALRTDGTLWCWGRNDSGQLGNGNVRPQTLPVRVRLGASASAVAAGGSHTCAKKSDGTLWCWGENNYGEIGDGTTVSPKLIPFRVALLGADAAEVSLGSLFTCARKRDASVWCWGYNYDGQLGTGVAANSSVPVPYRVTALPEDVQQIEAGAGHTCARTRSGAVWCWGNNVSGQLGNGGTAESEPSPMESAGLSTCVARIAAGESHTCALGADGTVHCWGYNEKGQLGAPPSIAGAVEPELVPLADQMVALDAGSQHTCALSVSRALWCWGDNEFGQLGTNSPGRFSSEPVELDVVGAEIVSVHAGYTHNCAITTDKNLWCWGDNRFGQLGNGESGNVASKPVAVTALCNAQ